MKYASAMKYGGELVDAIECDYDSFKQLVPLCPNCKEPVYLRAGGDRTSKKGKPYKIGAHWCHFKGVSDEQVASCESRVNGYSEKDKQRIAAKARGQRLKLLQRWFWSVFVNQNCNPVLMEVSMIVDDFDPEDIEDRFLDQSSEYLCNAMNPQNKPTELNGVKQYEWLYSIACQNPWFNNPTIRDVEIAAECIGFLTSRKNISLFRDVLAVFRLGCFFYFRMATGNDEDGDSPYEEWIEKPEFVSRELITAIFSIPWASEFQRLEAESQQGAAS